MEKYLPFTVFNYVVKSKDKKVFKEQVLELLENILYYLPANHSNEVNFKVFSKAMKQYAEPFEADYIADRLIKYRTYRVVKLYRNWSAHNLFEKDEKMDFKVFCFLVIIESLMFIEIQADTEDTRMAKESQKSIESVRDTCYLFFKDNDFINESAITKELQDLNWKMCEEQKKIPLDMIDVYDNLGKKNKVRYSYLFDSYMNCFIENNIDYKGNGCNTNYSISDSCDDIHKELFVLAYRIMKELAEK